MGNAVAALSDHARQLEEIHEFDMDRLDEAMAVNRDLKFDHRSLVSVKSARTLQESRLNAVFDSRDTTPFLLDTTAGRQQLSRGVRGLEASLLQSCTNRRGSWVASEATAEGAAPITASITKRQAIVAKFLENVLEESGDAGIDEVLAHLPQKMQAYVGTLRFVQGSLKRAFAVLKSCRGAEARNNYYVLATAIAPPPVAQRHQTGMARRVADLLGVQRGSVFRRQQGVRFDTIHEGCRRRCPESPCMKDECRRNMGKGHWESARAMFRFETNKEYWAWFCVEYPGTATEIASKVHPEEPPRAFLDNQPWNLRNKGGDSCLCQSCEGMQKKMQAASRAGALLQELFDSEAGSADAGRGRRGRGRRRRLRRQGPCLPPHCRTSRT